MGTPSPIPRPTSSRGSSACAAKKSSIPSAGTITALLPSAGCRTTTASAVIRASAYDPSFTPPGPDRPKDAASVPASRRNFIELCRELTESTSTPYEQAWRQLGLSVDWSTSYRTINDYPAAVSQRAFLKAIATGDAYQALRPGAVGRDVRNGRRPGRDRGPPGAGSYWRLAFGHPGRHRRQDRFRGRRRHDQARTAASLRGAGRASQRRAVPAALRPDGPHAAVRRAGADPQPSPGRPGQGHRHRDGLHVRRHHRRDLVA